MEVENAIVKKLQGTGKERRPFSLSRKENCYVVVYELHKEQGHSIAKLCKVIGVSRSGYYKWLKNEPSALELTTEKIAKR
ncbi:hypothetical protein [Enterococcus wangshanyuanii]|uniref:hypothetical protein n=1 Tax=Enterococcus wangshanyuanii TaxID=2005703 RepID=UPI00138F9D56|nr:hypothetical protein [Enterococcus wangshanyuanii]